MGIIWSKSIIHPVYKKRDVRDCNNYKGITLVKHLHLYGMTDYVISPMQIM